MAIRQEQRKSTWQILLGNMDVLMAVAFVAIVAIIVIPITPLILDFLLTINITFSLVVLLITLFTTDVRQMQVFPSLLLTATLFRLALNISSTRLILRDAAAGDIIKAFGNFVVAGDYVVGLVIFIIITVVQFVVITNGAGRIAEVAARFTLDAMPGKQMSIDADFNAGLIDEETARRRRKEVQKEADFYGAMDGASKFVRGDAIAGIVIVLVNIIGGLAVGMLRRGLSLAEATQVYTILTVGDGLVAQIPALLISVSAGMLVTRSTAEESFGQELTSQLLAFPKVLIVVSLLLLFFGLVPGLPFWPFFLLAGGCGFLAYTLNTEEKRKKTRLKEEKERKAAPSLQEKEDFSALLQVETLEIELGYNLVPLTDSAMGGDLLERITAARRRVIAELGLIIHPIRIRDNLHLPPNDYVIKIKGNEVARGELRYGYRLALNPDGALPDVEGIETREPTFNLPAMWIRENQQEAAEMAGCTVVDTSTVLITHLTEVIKNNAHELLGRQAVRELLEAVRAKNAAVVDELAPDVLSLGEIQKVLQNLLREKIPLHNLETILEALADHARRTKDIDHLTEYVRQALSRTISRLIAGGAGKIQVITIDPVLEKKLIESLQLTAAGTMPLLEPQQLQKLVDGISNLIQRVRAKGISPVILTAPRLRLPLYRLLERFLPQATIISINELVPQLEVEAVGVIASNGN